MAEGLRNQQAPMSILVLRTMEAGASHGSSRAAG